MTPEEKAKELVEKFTLFLGTDRMGAEYYVDTLDAKRCALICVNELKKQVMSFDYSLAVSQNDYLEQVKQEIDKP